MRLLRDRAGLTQMLLLLELQRKRHTSLRTLAERLGITVQAVSQHVAELEKAGLVQAARGDYALTAKGTQQLLEQVGELKGFADLAFRDARAIERCTAVARTAVSEGQAVGLFLEEGVLVARGGKSSPSRGTAAHDAAAGELLRVEGLEGLVDLAPGKVVVLEVPVAEGARTAAAAGALRRWLARQRLPATRIAAMGTEAQALALAAGLEGAAFFAPVAVAHHAAELGLDAVVLAAPEQARFAASELARMNESAFVAVKVEHRRLRVGR